MSQKKTESTDRYNVTDIVAPFDIRCDIKIEMVPMRDGVKLLTAIYFPRNFKGKGPVVMARSPYTRTNYFELPYGLALDHNCINIMQACRGTGWSEGGVIEAANDDAEKNDFEDFFKWLAEQEWFDGRCAMYGSSFSGWTQWCAMRAGFDGLRCITPRVAPIRQCSGAGVSNGVIKFSFPAKWSLAMYHRRTYGYANVPDMPSLGAFEHLPVIDIDKFMYDKEIPNFRTFMKRAEKPAEFYGEFRNWFKDFRAPAFIAGGWFDMFKEDTLETFRLMRSSAATPEARKFTRLTIGPWAHSGLVNPDYFGAENNYAELVKRTEKFMFGLLDAPDTDPLGADDPIVKYFMMGENRWYTAGDWPPPGAVETSMYLHSNGNANSIDGNGSIDSTLPGDEYPDHYISDPNNPVRPPATGNAPAGCYDRSEMEKRSDMLVYTTKEFTEPLTLTGKVKLKFSASVSTVDTDFFATLTDVLPDGRSMLLTTGGVRARYRKGLEKEELLTPGQVYEFEITLGDVAVKFPAGHKMRLELHGQEFPQYLRNANTGNAPFDDEKLFCAACTIYHDAARPAELILPKQNW